MFRFGLTARSFYIRYHTPCAEVGSITLGGRCIVAMPRPPPTAMKQQRASFFEPFEKIPSTKAESRNQLQNTNQSQNTASGKHKRQSSGGKKRTSGKHKADAPRQSGKHKQEAQRLSGQHVRAFISPKSLEEGLLAAPVPNGYYIVLWDQSKKHMFVRESMAINKLR